MKFIACVFRIQTVSFCNCSYACDQAWQVDGIARVRDVLDTCTVDPMIYRANVVPSHLLPVKVDIPLNFIHRMNHDYTFKVEPPTIIYVVSLCNLFRYAILPHAIINIDFDRNALGQPFSAV